ncbi:MAG: DUF3488 domain-containing protein, partial [Gammaproteobacteria bacterium]|nr:DUF3488 domain-containing protein [Gammaproteobacteria bacterium]
MKPEIQRLVLILAIMASLPHTLHLPWKLNLFFIVLAIWRYISLSKSRLSPGRVSLGLLTLLGVFMVYSEHQTLMGREAGVSLLTIMLTLKLMELRKPRDIYVVCFMSYFVVVTQFLFSESFLLTLYLLCTIIGITTLLLEINRHEPSRQFSEPLKTTLTISLQAIPIAAILFLLFPRISQPLWSLDLGQGSGLTGLDDRVSPGSISRLIQSPDIAFRATFSGPLPPPEKRYWRGLVIWDTNGMDWFNQSRLTPRKRSPQLTSVGNSYDYEIQLEAHFKKWLFSLDLPAQAPPGAGMTSDFQLITSRNVEHPRRYHLRSHTRYLTQRPDQLAVQRALVIPDNVTERQA